MSLADFIGNLYGGTNPLEEYISPEQRKALGRKSWLSAANALKGAPDLFSGLMSAYESGGSAYNAGVQDFAKTEMAKREYEAEQERQRIAMEQIRQSMELAKTEEGRRSEKFKMDSERHQKNMAIVDSTEARNKTKFERESEEYERVKALRESRAKAGHSVADAFAENDDERALFTALADSEDFGTLWNVIAQRKLPSTERWNDPVYRPGVGLIQTNARTNQTAVLWKEPTPSQANTVKPKTVTVSPSQINKMKIDILEKELIPQYIKNKPKEKPWYDVTSWFSDDDEAAPAGPMTPYGMFGEIPSELIQKAEQEAIKRYTTTYKDAWEKVNGRTLSGQEVSSPRGGPVPNNNNMSSLSSQMQLDMAIRMKMESMPEFAGLDEEDKESAVQEILEQIENRIKNNGGTYESAIDDLLRHNGY